MADATDRELSAAEERGQAVLANGPRAVSAKFDRSAGRILVELADGCVYGFPPALVEDLQDADIDALSEIEVDGHGLNLHWPRLDVDLLVPALISGIFGTKAWITRELARAAGRTTSSAKAAAARTNGAKGGRPRKIAQG
jgi:hypothetical protein